MSHRLDEIARLVRLRRQLTGALAEVHRQLRVLSGPEPDDDYRIALRPDVHGADPMNHRTLLDDIVVMRPYMFRAEQMDTSSWWVACYLDNESGDRICWDLRAHARPKHLSWTTSEFPESDVVYEHNLKAAAR